MTRAQPDLIADERPKPRGRCEVDTAGERDEILSCEALARLLDARKRPLRYVDSIESLSTGEERNAVVIELASTRRQTVWTACRFCPCCGASIETNYRRVKP